MYNIFMIVNGINHVAPKSITPSGFFGSGLENIVELENFMTEKELDFLSNFVRNLDTWDQTETKYNKNGTVIYESNYWENRVATEGTLNKVNVNVPSVIRGMMNRLRSNIEHHFLVTVNPTAPTLVRWLPGQYQKPHADKELHEGKDAGTPNSFPHYDIASLFYLNDDYSGGELYFPKQNLQFKPKAGAAYFFPGDMNYIHGVTEVEEGIRYTCPFFWNITDHTGEKKP
jgi:hypothetical protein